jgi:hypothetical protein
MGQSWMKVELTTPDKVEIHQMSEILNIDSDCVLGKLVRVWGWFNEHSTDGVEPISVANQLNTITRNNHFCDAMLEVGWLVINKKTIKIPSFDRHNSKGSKQRALNARRQGAYKDKQAFQLEHNDIVTPNELPDKNRLEKIRIDKSYSPVVEAIDTEDSKLDIFKAFKEDSYE